VKKNFGDIGIKVIDILFFVLLAGILIATILVDKNIKVSFPNTVKYANSVYYILAALAIMGVLIILYKTKNYEIGQRAFYGMLLGMAAAAAFLEWHISSWMYDSGSYIPGVADGDFGSVMNAAISLAGGGSFAEFPYFSRSPNNANITIFLSAIYKMVPNWKTIIFLNALGTNVAALLASLTVYHLTNNKKVSLFLCGVGEILIALTWRSFLVYTDSWGLLFVALILYAFSTKMDYKYKIPLIFALGAMGTFIKMTVFVCIIALALYQLIIWLENEKKKVELKKIGYIVLCFVMLYGVMAIVQNMLHDHFGLEKSERAKEVSYFFMVGQNTKYYGTVNSEDGNIRVSMIKKFSSKSELNKAFLEEGINRIKRRELTGNIAFYIGKLNVAYNDGYFHNVQKKLKDTESSVWKQLYSKQGNGYAILANTFQTIWDGILLLLLIGMLLKKFGKNDIYVLFEILILGVTLYLMCFEGRSKYIYMFLPVYLCTAGIALHRLSNFFFGIKERKNKRNGMVFCP